MSEIKLSMGNPHEVVTAAAKRYNTQTLQIRDSTVNYVGIADERLVFKAPKSMQSIGSLAVEAAALELLEKSRPLTVPVPRLVEFSANPAYLVATYLPGHIVEAATLDKISLKDREALGHGIGAFVVAAGQYIDVEVARHEIPSLGEADTWESIFRASVGNFSSPTFPSTSILAARSYAQWIANQTNETTTQFIHGDLRLGNMVVSEQNKLTGVFDFGRAGVDDASYEISPLVNLDATITRGAIDELQAANIDVDIEQIHLWDEMKKLSQLIHYIKANVYQADPPTFVKRACRILASRHPSFNWDEFNQLLPIK